MRSLLHRTLRLPRALAREALDALPAETRIHTRAAVREGGLALRSLADGATEATERIIDHISRRVGEPPEGCLCPGEDAHHRVSNAPPTPCARIADYRRSRIY